MEQINNVQLHDPSVFPDEQVLKRVLGCSYSVYLSLLDLFQEYGLSHEWRYYNDGKAWLCKVQKRAKTIVWMSAWEGYIKATVYFPERYIDGIYDLDIPEEEKKRIRESRNVGKSKPCMFDMKTTEVIPIIGKVIEYKMGCK